MQREAWNGSPSGGRAALAQLAPRAAACLEAIESAAWSAADAAGRVDLLDLAARVQAGQHGLEPLARPERMGPSPWTPDQAARWRDVAALGEGERAALRFAEQLSWNVASLGDEERRGLFERLGSAALPFAQALWAADFLPRTRTALDALFGEDRAPGNGEDRAPGALARGSGTAGGDDLSACIDALIRCVPQLDSLDPVTTELVRLLGARRHRCRLCQSLRSRPALAAGAGETEFDAVDRHAASDLAAHHKAALAFADAVLSAPGRIEPAAVETLRDHFGPAACAELVLDLTRNATNKIAVALAADAPHVESGVEIYDIGPDGELRYGLEAP